MHYDDDRAPAARTGPGEAREARERPEADSDAEHLHAEHLLTGGGLHYQQARRQPDEQAPGATPSRPRRESADADQQQRAEEHPALNADDESWLQEQGYPKLGRNMHARVTQVEHGPYAGGTQQGGAPKKRR